MLSTIKSVLKNIATDRNLNFAFVSFKELNDAVENIDLSIPTIAVNSTIRSKQTKTQGNVINQVYDIHIACIQKREIEDSDEIVFDEVIAPLEEPFIQYLNAVSESQKLNSDLGDMNIETLYFATSSGTSGLQSKIKLSTFCNQ